MCQPAAPNPQSVIQQQTASNRETAITQAGLNMVNQTDAAGNSLNYEQIGTWPDGTPRYSAKQSLGAAGQALQTANQGTAQNLATLAQDQSARLPSLLNAPIDFTAQKDYLEGLTAGALDKSWDRQAEQFETSLINRGIRPGSTGYQQQQNDFQTNRSDAYNSANVNNYNTALQSQLALRQQPINEILALAGGSQLQQPQFASTPSTGVGGVDTAGIQQQAWENQVAGYDNQQSLLGGLFSAGGSLLKMLPFSDARLKTDIEETGETIAGVPVVEWNWKGGFAPRETGVLAQDLEKKHPELVDNTHPSGFKRVDYGGLVAEALSHG